MNVGNIFPHDPQGLTLPAFGDGLDPSLIDVRTIDLSKARANEVLITNGGNFVWIMAATDTNANLGIKFSEQWNGEFIFRKGMVVKGIAFSDLVLTNEAQAGKTITLVITRQAGLEGVSIENAAEALSQTQASIPNNYGVIPTHTATVAISTQILAANSDRVDVMLTNTGTVGLWIRDDNSLSASGHFLPVGASHGLTSGGEIWVYNPDAGTAGQIDGVYTEFV